MCQLHVPTLNESLLRPRCCGWQIRNTGSGLGTSDPNKLFEPYEQVWLRSPWEALVAILTSFA